MYKRFHFQTILPDGSVHQEGLEYDMVVALAESVNAKIKIGLPTDGKVWGDDKGNMPFTEVIGNWTCYRYFCMLTWNMSRRMQKICLFVVLQLC